MTALTIAQAAAARALTQAGVDDPARDARLLVAHALGLPPDRLILSPGLVLDGAQSARLDALVAARVARQPMAQILGYRDFWRHRFIITPDVLDPRPETEVLVALALAEPFSRVLDLGTGSGAILLSLLADRADATGLGTDLSPAALRVAEANADALRLAPRATFQMADWFQGVAGRFDLIVSNPPYIPAADLPGLAPEVRGWEPALALSPLGDPGGDGLGAYRAISAGMRGHLALGGRLLVEVGAGQAPAVAALLARAGLAQVAIHPDLDGRGRVVAGRVG